MPLKCDQNHVNDDLLLDDPQAEFKVTVRTNKTLTSVVEGAFRETLDRQRRTEERTLVELTTVSGGGLQPGVDLDDSAALLALMEESSDPA